LSRSQALTKKRWHADQKALYIKFYLPMLRNARNISITIGMYINFGMASIPDTVMPAILIPWLPYFTKDFTWRTTRWTFDDCRFTARTIVFILTNCLKIN
jgi:hypothetical protein